MWDVGLASMFKERDNKEKIGPCIGKVVSPKPLKISILDGMIVLAKDKLYISEILLDTYKRKCKINGGTESSFEFTDTLKVDDKVLLIPFESEQLFTIVCKIKKVGD